MSDIAKCAICGDPMPAGEEMFKYHGYSGDCPKQPLPKPTVKQKIPGLVAAVAVKDNRKVSMLFDTNEQANAFVAGIEADEVSNVELSGRSHLDTTEKNIMENYILEGKKAVLCDMLTWAKWFEKADRQVARDQIGDADISTVFIGIDYSFGFGPLMLFETMVFGGHLNQEQNRCSTWEEAEKMHSVMVERVRTKGTNI